MGESQDQAWASLQVHEPGQGAAEQLFVLLHDGGAEPAQQLQGLAAAVRQAFPQSVVAMPRGSSAADAALPQWFEQQGLSMDNYVQRVAQALPALVGLVQQLQRKYDLDGEHTALAGFGHGATLALEACSAHPELAGRVVAFGGVYASLPMLAPPATTLHLLHGADDPLVPLSFMRETHEHLAQLQGDATLDIASRVGHELHNALIRQAIYRLQTCIPLRNWKAALGDLRGGSEGQAALQALARPPDDKLH